jgi:hypothetical protein
MFIAFQPSRDGASSEYLYLGEAARAAQAARHKEKTTLAARLMR